MFDSKFGDSYGLFLDPCNQPVRNNRQVSDSNILSSIRSLQDQHKNVIHLLKTGNPLPHLIHGGTQNLEQKSVNVHVKPSILHTIS